MRNNENVISNALRSLLPLHGKIIIGNLGSEDDTLKICSSYGAEVVDVTPDNLAKARNILVSKNNSPWQFFIEPWEVLAVGHQFILNLKEPDIYGVQVFRNDIISKEARLWHKNSQVRFIQPVYEVLNKDPQQFGEVVISSHKIIEDWDTTLKSLENWELENPLAKEVCYYKAFALLGQQKYKEFIAEAHAYLLRDSVGVSSVMMQYYLALIQFYTGDIKASVRGVVSCITAQPLMSEFWCLLGDIYYKLKYYKKAILYYENAMILGSHRLKTDAFPIEISKYKAYPTSMIESCNIMLRDSKILQKTTR